MPHADMPGLCRVVATDGSEVDEFRLARVCPDLMTAEDRERMAKELSLSQRKGKWAPVPVNFPEWEWELTPTSAAVSQQQAWHAAAEQYRLRMAGAPQAPVMHALLVCPLDGECCLATRGSPRVPSFLPDWDVICLLICSLPAPSAHGSMGRAS